MSENKLDARTANQIYHFIQAELCDDHWGVNVEGVIGCSCGGREILRQIKLAYPDADKLYTHFEPVEGDEDEEPR